MSSIIVHCSKHCSKHYSATHDIPSDLNSYSIFSIHPRLQSSRSTFTDWELELLASSFGSRISSLKLRYGFGCKSSYIRMSCRSCNRYCLKKVIHWHYFYMSPGKARCIVDSLGILHASCAYSRRMYLLGFGYLLHTRTSSVTRTNIPFGRLVDR